MPLPRIAIVGRPNVGKSSLMNMIAGAKVSIVDPSAGTTRDRVSAILELPAPFKGQSNKVVEIVDTGGFGAYVADGARFDEVGNDLARLTDSIEFQIAQAVEGADVVLLAVDAQAGITPLDREIARLLREHRLGGKKDAKTKKAAKPAAARPPVHVIATKVDGPKWESHAHELSGLGFGPPLLVSAKNNYFRREFLDRLWEVAPLAAPDEARRAPADLYVAIVGKRNAGKSTLVNTLAGEPRMIVSEIAGTTRDAVDVRFEFGGRTLVAIDTAGLRKKKSFQNMIEVYALDRLQRAVDRADVVLLLLDATEKISQVDEQVAMMAQKSFKPAIVLVNKWDLAQGRPGRDGRPVTTRHFEDYVRGELKGLAYAPIAFVSGQQGLNVRKTIDLAFELREQSRARVTTGKLNRLVRGIVEQKGPPDIRGRFAKVYYVAQTGVEPPTITLVVNHPEMFTPGYLRFLTNRFREELPYSEVPVRIVVRERRQREVDLVAADEGGKGATIRVVKGRKGVKERLAGRRAEGAPAAAEPADALGDRWLDDDLSTPVEIDQLSENADDYFDDDE